MERPTLIRKTPGAFRVPPHAPPGGQAVRVLLAGLARLSSSPVVDYLAARKA